MAVHESRDRFGHFFEEFEPGDVYRHFPGRTITQYDNLSFTLLTMNQGAGHLDQHYAATEMDFDGKLLVNGLLVLSIVHGLSTFDISSPPKAIAHLGWQDIQVEIPTFHGDTLYAETEILDKRRSSSKPDRGIVTVRTTGKNQRDQTVISFKRSVLVKVQFPEAP